MVNFLNTDENTKIKTERQLLDLVLKMLVSSHLHCAMIRHCAEEAGSHMAYQGLSPSSISLKHAGHAFACPGFSQIEN